MSKHDVVTSTLEQRLLSKEAIKLPPKERLNLLLTAKRYPMVSRGTSANKQIEEMIDLYHLLGIMLAKYLPNEKAESNFILLSILSISAEQKQSLVSNNVKLADAFKLLNSYEELERKITAIQNLFWEYVQTYPNIADSYELEYLAMQDIAVILENGRYALQNATYVEKLLKRWELF